MESETLRSKNIQQLKCRGMLRGRRGSDVFTALPSLLNYFVRMSRHSWTCFSACSCGSRRVVQSAEHRNAKCIGETRLSALSGISPHSHFQFDSPWFNVSQLKLTTLKGNQCNRFLGSLLFLSPL